MPVSAQLQVEMEGGELPTPPPPPTSQTEGLLSLESQHVVGTEDAGLGQQLAETPLEADEGKRGHTPLPITAMPPASLGSITDFCACW